MKNDERLEIIKIQNELKSLFSEVAKILTKNNVKHWIHSGTLLGYIRDNGFIEWDDDLDIMVSYKEWSDCYEEIIKGVESSNLEIFDFSLENPKIASRLKNARIYSKIPVEICTSKGKKNFFPYIDIFFSAPVDHFKNSKMWIWYEWMYKISWVFEKGFNRYNQKKGKIRAFWYNIISMPLKIIFPNRKIIKMLNSPKHSNGNWNYLTRFDYWTHRKTYYDVSKLVKIEFMGTETMMYSDFEDELVKTFGKDWKTPKYRDPHFEYKISNTSISNNKIYDYLNKKV